MKFACIALIAATSAVSIKQWPGPGAFDGQHNCENGDSQRTFYAGAKSFISNSSQHASCTNNIGDAVDVQLAEDDLLAQLSNTLVSAQRSEAKGDGDAAVAKTAAIKNI